ncbi:STAS domain-containing protein [Shewanella sp. SR44-3]|uniref:STAS domain-containing protein n=1 Tax=unclassified Shewanella TaxID=196818 RepID=UPI0015FE1029|nr:STAS domain-containing protein [Shewanella sp. SR44-3]MBB1269957.1 STAS domain-containing protein [Shewanella sp. SR44-3]
MIEFIQQGEACAIQGSLSQQQVIELWSKRRKLFSPSTQVLDLSGITYVDSAGVALLLELAHLSHKGSPKRQSPRMFIKPSKPLSKMIELYDLEVFVQ